MQSSSFELTTWVSPAGCDLSRSVANLFAAATLKTMTWWFAGVESGHEFQNPTSAKKIRLLGERLGLGSDSQVLARSITRQRQMSRQEPQIRRRTSQSMRMKRAIALLALATLLAAVPVNASSAWTDSGASELGATNTFTSARSGYVEVELNRDARWKWDPFDSSSLRISGDGRAAGFLLVRQDVDKPQGIYGAAFRLCEEPGCSKGWSSWLTRLVVPIGLKWPKKGSTFTVPAGRYRAYVIADGAPVTARLTLQDLEGATRLSPTSPVDASVGMHPAKEPVKNVLTAGSTFELDSQGAALLGFVERHQLGAADAFNDCLYDGAPALPREIAFTPACRAAGAEMGFGSSSSLPPLTSSGGSGSYSIKPSMAPGTYSFGGSYVRAQSVRDAAFLSLWVNYD